MNRPVIGGVGRQPIVSVSASVRAFVRVWPISVCSTAEQREVEVEVEVSAPLTPTASLASLQCLLTRIIHQE